MLQLNLLPPKQKETFGWEKNQRFVVLNAGIFSLLLVFFSILLLSAIFYVKIQLEPLTEAIARTRLREETRRVENLKKQIGGVTTSLERLRGIQEHRDAYLFFLREFVRLSRQGVVLTSVAVAEGSGTQPLKNVRVSGHADTRDQLIEFENLNREHSYFDNLVSPSFPNKTKETDIDFSFTFTFAPPS